MDFEGTWQSCTDLLQSPLLHRLQPLQVRLHWPELLLNRRLWRSCCLGQSLKALQVRDQRKLQEEITTFLGGTICVLNPSINKSWHDSDHPLFQCQCNARILKCLLWIIIILLMERSPPPPPPFFPLVRPPIPGLGWKIFSFQTLHVKWIFCVCMLV